MIIKTTKEEAVVIGRLLAGTTVTKAMIDDMLGAMSRGEPPHTYFDTEAVKVEQKDIRALNGPQK